MNKKLHPGMALVFVATLTCGAVSAQIATDGSLGAVKSLAGANINIPESLGKTDGSGSNLFHSFSRFNVGKDQSVYFVGRDGIRNVLARVTGGERSAINGTLGIQRPGGMMPVPIDTANLWLINPAGIHFGPSARLDVGGSFFTGSADRIVFSDGAVFDATPTKPTLTAASPASFGFVNANPSQVDIEGSDLAVADGQALVIAAGDLNIRRDAKLTATEVNLTASGDILLDNADILAAIDIDGGQFVMNAGDSIAIRNGTRLDASGVGTGEGGLIEMMASNSIVVEDSNIDASVENKGAKTEEFFGDIKFNADDIDITRSAITTRSTGDRGAGDITLTADRLTVTESTISASARGTGEGGFIDIGTTQTISLTDTDIIAAVNDGVDTPDGVFGDIRISTPATTRRESVCCRIDSYFTHFYDYNEHVAQNQVE